MKAQELAGDCLLPICCGGHLFYDAGVTYALQLQQPDAGECVLQVLHHLHLQESKSSNGGISRSTCEKYTS